MLADKGQIRTPAQPSRKRLMTNAIPAKKPMKKPAISSGTSAPTSAPIPAPIAAQSRLTASSRNPAPATSRPVVGGSPDTGQAAEPAARRPSVGFHTWPSAHAAARPARGSPSGPS